MTLSDLLAQYDITEDELSTSLEVRLSAHPLSRTAELTEGEEAYWADHAGIPLARPSTSTLERATDATVSVLADARRSLTIEQAARLLDVHRSRVSHRLGDGQLYSFQIGTKRRLPSWQFTAAGLPLPGLDVVLGALPSDLHPTAVEGFFSTPNPDLDDRSPAQWLASGGDPQRVVDEVSGLDLW